MNWGNYGSNWVIDHFLPVISYNLEQSDEQRECFHWTNIQPLWKISNLEKGCSIPTDEEQEQKIKLIEQFLEPHTEEEKSILLVTKGSVTG